MLQREGGERDGVHTLVYWVVVHVKITFSVMVS